MLTDELYCKVSPTFLIITVKTLGVLLYIFVETMTNSIYLKYKSFETL